MYEFIYLLQTRESLRNNEEIYKVGRTCKNELKRFNNYPKGSILHLHISCVNSCEIENKIINIFNHKFTNIDLYGKEYFEGNLLEMLTIILQQVSLYFNCLSTSIDYCKKLQQYENTNNTLTEDLKTEITNNESLKIEVVKLQQENKLLKRDKIPLKEDTEIENSEFVTSDIVSSNHTCSKCFKTFSRKSIKLTHESKCDGLDTRQCKICLNFFATSQSKWNHNNHVKCSPPIQQPHTVNNIIINNDNNDNNDNITNNNSNNNTNIDMSTTNIQNNNNIQLTLNFGNEDLSGLINEPNYMRNVERQIQSFISQ